MREIGVGDLLRAWHALGASDEATREAIRDVLLPEFAWLPKEETLAPRPDARREQLDLPEPPAPPEPDQTSKPAGRGTSDEDASALLDVPFSVEPMLPRSQPIRLPTSGPRLAADRDLAPELEPLLDARWARRVIGGLIAMEAPLGDLDVPRLVRSLTEMREVRRLPRKRQPTLRFGAQVLLDRHPSMMVFYSDQSALRPEIEGIVGRERTLILRCDRFPPTEVSELATPRWRPYESPLPGTPVLVVSDLGMARGAFPLSRLDEAEWDAFLAPLLSAGSPVLALVPCELDRYPAFVRERVRLLLWDWSTRPSDARRARKARV